MIKSLKARASNQGLGVIIALLQPTPETVRAGANPAALCTRNTCCSTCATRACVAAPHCRKTEAWYVEYGQVDLFDDILLLREGATVYHGPRESLVQYMQGIGFFPPSHTGGARPPA